MAKQLSFLILEDHSLVLNAFRNILLTEYVGCQVDCYKTVEDLMDKVIDFDDYDLLISDIQLEHSTSHELLKKVKRESSLPILIVSMHNSYRAIIEMQEIGVDGYILKDDADHFKSAIDEILLGNRFYSPKVQRTLDSVGTEVVRLSKRQMDVLKYWEMNFTNEKIAKELFISVETVKSHKRSIRLITQKHDLGDVLEFLRSNKVI